MPEALNSDQAFNLQVEVVERVAGQRSTWVGLAGGLAAFHRGCGWKALGMGSFNEWLAQPEISLSRNAAYAMISAWRELVEERGADVDALATLDISKVAVVLPAIKRGDIGTEDALSDCEVLSRSDLRGKYQAASEAEYRVCEACGQRMKVTE